ncbi:Putative uncharacterized protein [Taphrina deformans PYCC 5710]|uniref:Uncharacterized protein n=1 Tax=Taphrina deformans (strain PYCC 5710 / ATCC 11124 / CBS 356.35 / IMI 108563 / JCM 9778 / NBRC 8474) TaxID=1097556 RepID=R4X7G1_TAPDE|nr:Putative uncharacterized protein [Taphrina deformans PYCC 5710]|eukprot:CCG81299.1 Putative uncharacterized protein [Taphrina deformans PYCC 5710]
MKEKVLRRAELSRITRMLRSRLEIAQFKVGRSWQNLPFKSVEPQLEREVKLRHPEAFENTDLLDHPSLASPPREVEFLVPDLPNRARHNDEGSALRQSPFGADNATTVEHAHQTRQGTSPLKRQRSPSPPHDSPVMASSPLNYRASSSNIRERMDPRSPNGHYSTPPPSTPPPSHLRSARTNKADTEEGADLLLYLATSPSPAKSRRVNRAIEFSSPPPIRGSSAVNTPVGAGFNLSEFLNFSPSPAPAARGRFDGNKFSPAKLTYDDSPARLSARVRDLEGG